jgi:hypothetical protein
VRERLQDHPGFGSGSPRILISLYQRSSYTPSLRCSGDSSALMR